MDNASKAFKSFNFERAKDHSRRLAVPFVFAIFFLGKTEQQCMLRHPPQADHNLCQLYFSFCRVYIS